MEFAAGLAALQGELEPLETSWDAACPDGDGLVFGALAGQGEVLNEGEVLARTRLSGLAGVLGSVTPVQPQAEFELLDSIHPDLPANGLDGAIVYATTKGTTVVALPKKICQSLFVLKFPTVESSFQELAKAIGNQGFDATVGPGVATNRRASALSPLLYLDPTAKPFDGNFNAAIAEVKAAFPNIDPRQFILLTISPKEATAADLAIHGKRTKSFMAELGGQNLLEGVRNGGDKPLPGTCPAITLLAFLG